jgi:hypothetical protein
LNENTTPSLFDAAKAITGKPDEYERMAVDFVRLANENRIAMTGREISQPVQDFMHDNLLKAAEHPPLEHQIERASQIAQSLGHPEPQHENALESSLYAAQYAPNRSELLNDFTARTETAFAREQPLALTHEPEQSSDFQSWHQSVDDFSIDMD